jgi:hypothetical protein
MQMLLNIHTTIFIFRKIIYKVWYDTLTYSILENVSKYILFKGIT